ncbi:MAG: SPOR domain-containing protein [Bacteroidales bacterium]
MRRYILLALLGVLLTLGNAMAQTQGVLSKKWYGNWSVGISGGPVVFFGDLKVHKFFPATSNMNEIRYAGSFSLIRQLSHVFALRGQVLYGEISGTKRVYKNDAPCNQYFEGNLLEYNLNTTINFSNLLFRYKPKRIFFIYGTVGVGMANWITKKKDLNTHQQIGGSGSASNWTTEWMIPAGLGGYFNIHDKVNLGIEWSLRGVNSDKLDATVGGFPYDMYSFLSVNLVYNFNKRNPVELSSAQPTRPPVVLPKPTYEKPPSTTQPITPVQDSLISSPLLPPPPPDTLTKTSLPDQADEIPYQHPGLDADVFYRIQILSSKTGSRSAASAKAYFNLSLPVIKELSEGYYRYYVGEFEVEAEASQFVQNLRRKPGLSQAFVVKYINGRRELTHPK